MPNEWTYGKQDKNSWFLTFCLVLMGIALNQSSELRGINFSFADLILSVIVIHLILRRMLVFPFKPLLFFLAISVMTIFSATLLVPSRFPYNPEPLRILNDYTKLLAAFLYFLVGYNLERMERGHKILKWFTIASCAIGLLAFLPFMRSRISHLYFGSDRYRGLMNDPNYFSVLQSCAIAYVFGTQRHALKKYVALFILVGSILMSASKTGMVTLGVYLCLKLMEPLFQRKYKLGHVILRLGTVSLVLVLAPILFGKGDDILNYMVTLIPQFERVAVLFRNFGLAMSGGGSSRDITWQTGIKLVGSSPIFGVGVETYTGITTAMWGAGAIAHNTYIQLAAEWGLPMSLFFFATIFWQLIGSTIKGKSGSELRIVYRDIIVVFLLGSFAISLNNARLLWITLGLLVRSSDVAIRGRETRRKAV